MKVLMCLPFTGEVPALAAHSLIPMACHARKNGIEVSNLSIGMCLIYIARELAAEEMLKGGYDALLFVDDDMVVPSDMLTRLAEADKPIVSALAFRRSDDFEPCIFKKLNDKWGEVYHDYPKGLIEIDGVGMACCLIKREVFEKVPRPWFLPNIDLGEDLAFCRKAKQAGFSIWCDTNLVCGHMANEIIKEAHYVARRNACKKRGRQMA